MKIVLKAIINPFREEEKKQHYLVFAPVDPVATEVND